MIPHKSCGYLSLVIIYQDKNYYYMIRCTIANTHHDRYMYHLFPIYENREEKRIREEKSKK